MTISKPSIHRFTLRSTERCVFIDVTERVAHLVAESAIDDGLCFVFVPHTTAGVTLNEHCDPTVTHDLKSAFDRLAPENPPGYRHAEGDGDAHVKTSLVGSTVTIPLVAGALCLGTWQGIFLAEFDGPRDRNVLVKILAG